MIREFLTNIRVRFLLLVVVALLPAIALLFFTASEARDQAIADERQNARRLADLAAVDQGRLIDSTRQLLSVLSQLPEIKTVDETCPTFLLSLLTGFPLYVNLSVIDAAGSITCSAVGPPRGLDLSDRQDVALALAENQFATGGYRVDGVVGVPVLNTSYPIVDSSGTPTGVVSASIDLENLGSIPDSSTQSDAAIVTLIDGSGIVLARQPADSSVIGQSVRDDPAFARVLELQSGTTTTIIDDLEYLVAFAPLGGASTGSSYLTIATPRSDVFASSDRTFSRNLTRLGLVVLIVMIAAWIGGDLLGRRNADLHKELVRRIYDAFTLGTVDGLADIVADDFYDHDPMPGQSPGLQGLKQAIGLFRAAFPDGEMHVDDLVAERDMVVARVTLTGTHAGSYFGREGTDTWVKADGVEIFRIHNGKVSEGWSRFVLPDIDQEIDHHSGSFEPEDTPDSEFAEITPA